MWKNLNILNVVEELTGKIFYFQKGNHLFIRLVNKRSPTKILIDYEFNFEERFYKGFIYDKDKNHFYTLSEPNFSKYWYIVKEDPSDKFFAEVEIISPKDLISVSNGILSDSISIDGGYTSYKYKSDYPINHYLLFIAGGKYKV